MARKILVLGLVAGLMVMMTGCMGYLEYLDRTMKPNLNSFTATEYRAQNNYEVLGTVTGNVEAIEVLGVYVGGTDGQAVLWEEATKRYSGQKFTGIKDICASKQFIGVLPPVFSQIKTTYYGTVVREK